MMRRLGKKGQNWMSEETLKFVASIVVIALLIFFVWKIISIFMTNTDYEQAKMAMGEIEKLANGMSVGETKYYLIESPRNWIIKPRGGSLCVCNYKDDAICSSKGFCISLPSQAKILQSCSIPFKFGSSSAYLGSNCFAIYYVPELFQIVREKDYFIFGDAKTLITSSANPWGTANSFWMIQKGNSNEYLPAKISMSLGDEKSLGYFIDMRSYLGQNVVKQTDFFKSKESNIKMSDSLSGLVGNIDFFMYREYHKGILYFSGKNGLNINQDAVGWIDESGALWLDKNFLGKLFDISSEITFSSEKKTLPDYLSGELRLAKSQTHVVYKTNIITSKEWGMKI